MKEQTSSEAKQIVKSGTESKKVFSTIMDKEVTLSTRKTVVLNRKPEKKQKLCKKFSISQSAEKSQVRPLCSQKALSLLKI